MSFISHLYWILERKEHLEKMNNLPKHHGAGPNAAESARPALDKGTLMILVHRTSAWPRVYICSGVLKGKYFSFERALNSNCSAQVLYFKRGRQ